MKKQAKRKMTVPAVALAFALVAAVVCAPFAFAALNSGKATAASSQTSSSQSLGLTSNQTSTAPSQSVSSSKFSMGTVADTSVLATSIDRSATVQTASSAKHYDVDWAYGKSTNDYSTHVSGASFYETGGTYGVAVDIQLLDEYPIGTVIELSANGKTIQATVSDCGGWWSDLGHDYVMFDLMPGTAEQLGWTKSARDQEGILTVSWRVISYA